MQLKTLIAAAGLLAAAAASSAATIDLTTLDSTSFDTLSDKSGKFVANALIGDDWTFTLDAASTVSFGAQQTFSNVANAISSFAGVLVGHGALGLTTNGNQQNLGWAGNLAAGTYTVHITGTALAKNTQYTGTVSATPVPEPETYALMLAGLCAIGFVSSRRKAH